MEPPNRRDRRPFGERDEGERAEPLGSGAARRRAEERYKHASPYEPFQSSPVTRRAAPPLPSEAESEPPLDTPPTEPSAPPHKLDLDAEEAPAPGIDSYAGQEAAPLPLSARPRDRRKVSVQARRQARRAAAEAARATREEDTEQAAGPRFRSYRGSPRAAARAAAGLNLREALQALGTMLLTAVSAATIFTWWTPGAFEVQENSILLVAAATQPAPAVAIPTVPAPTATPSPAPQTTLRIGIVSGHWGNHPSSGLPDPGAVCEDTGLTERELNYAAATGVQARLEALGYGVDLLEEWDPRLTGYYGAAMISIHADSCGYVNDFATGFKVASFEASANPERDLRLVNCLMDRYGRDTGLAFHPSVTFDMTRYHNFAEIHPDTPGAIIEIGFMYLDREFLLANPDRVAQGITDGILCFLRNESVGTDG